MKLKIQIFLIALAGLLLARAANAENSTNLIVNPGAEISTATADWKAVTTIPGWTVISGSPSIVSYSITAFSTPDSTGGNAFFADGPYGDSSISQTVDVSSASTQIDTGTITYTLSGWLGGYTTYSGSAVVTAAFQNASGTALATAQLSGDTPQARANTTSFIAKSAAGAIPSGTRKIVVTIKFTNDSATYNTGYADNLSLVLSTPVAAATLIPPSSTVPAFDHVFVIMMENTTYNYVIGSSYAPYINSLANQGTLLTNYSGTYHPSDENYLSVAGGDTFVQGGVYYPNIHVNAQHLGDTIEAAGKTWKTYMQGMGTPGNLSNNYDSYYAPDDTPFINFTDMQGSTNAARRQAHMFDTSQLSNDLASASMTPNFAWIGADDYYDGEASGNGNSTSLQVQDNWLKQTIQPIMNSPAWQNERSLLILTWDESSDKSALNNHIATILVGSQGLVKVGNQVGTIMNHYNVARAIESALGLPSFTANDEYAQPINEAFQSTPPTISASPTTVATNGIVAVTVANGPGNITDWVGVYAIGSPNSPSLAWQYLNGHQTAPSSGLTNATLMFAMPFTNGQYEFRFFANDGYTLLGKSSTVTVNSPAPAAPTNLTASAGNALANLNWTASSGAASYNVKRSTTSDSEVTITNVTGTSCTNIGLTNGTTYYYVVSAVNANGESANSLEASVTPMAPPLTLTAALQSGPQFVLQFSGVDNQTYIVETSTNLTDWLPIYTNAQNGGQFDFTDTNMAGSMRFYRVRQ